MAGDGPLVVVGVGDAGEAVAVNWSAGSATWVFNIGVNPAALDSATWAGLR